MLKIIARQLRFLGIGLLYSLIMYKVFDMTLTSSPVKFLGLAFIWAYMYIILIEEKFFK